MPWKISTLGAGDRDDNGRVALFKNEPELMTRVSVGRIVSVVKFPPKFVIAVPFTEQIPSPFSGSMEVVHAKHDRIDQHISQHSVGDDTLYMSGRL